MQRVSWGCRISAYISSRKKKEADRASGDAELRLARTHPDGSGAPVTSGEEGLHRTAEMVGHVVRIRVASVARRFRERRRLPDDSW